MFAAGAIAGGADGFCGSDPLLLDAKSPKDAGALNKLLALPTGVVAVVVALATGKVVLLLVEEAKGSVRVFEPKLRRADIAGVSADNATAADATAGALAPNDTRGCPPPPPNIV